MNFKKVTENVGRSRGKGNPAKTITKVQVDILLNVLPSSSPEGGSEKDIIPKPCPEGQVGPSPYKILLERIYFLLIPFASNNLSQRVGFLSVICIFHCSGVNATEEFSICGLNAWIVPEKCVD